MGLADTLDLTLLIQAKTAGMSEIDSAKTKLGGLGMAAAAAGAVIAGGLGVALVDSVKKAATFQDSLTALVTGGGELQKNMDLVRSGILQMSTQVGVSATDLANGMYSIESAGFHGAAGLQVLKAAAEGAKVGSADMGTVANAVTSLLNAYGLSAKNSASVTSQLVETVASGKMHMQDLAGSLSAVLPVAAAAGISYAQVGGAIATMTAQGVSADQASQNLANTIRALQNPTQQATNEMMAMGLNSQTVSQQLGKKGLSGTLDELVTAITQHMGPAGLVIQSTFQSAQFAAKDAQQEISAMPPSLQKLATAFLNGTISQTQWRSDIKGLSVDQREMATQFASTADKTRSFNDLLKSGGPSAQTFSAALSQMLGGATGLNTALLVTGSHQATFDANVKAIGDSANKGGKDVQGWAEVTKDFNFKLSQLTAGLGSTAIQIGTAFLPALTSIAGYLSKNVLPLVDQFTSSLTGKVQAGMSGLASGLKKGGLQGGMTGLLSGLGMDKDSASQVGSFVSGAVTALGDMKDAATKVAGAIGTVVGAIGHFTGLAPILAGIAGAVMAWGIWQTVLNVQMAITQAMGMVTFVRELIGQMIIAASTEEGWAGVQAALNVLMDANPIGLIVIAIGVLVAIIVLAITHWKQIHAVITDVWNLMKQFGGFLGGEFVKAWDAVSSKVGGFFSELGTKVHDGINALGDWLKQHWLQILETALLVLPGGFLIDLAILFVTHFNEIKSTVGRILGDVLSFISEWGGRLLHIAEIPLLLMWAIWDTGMKLIEVLVSDALNAIGAFLMSHFGKQIRAVESYFTDAIDRYKRGWDTVKSTVLNAASAVEQWVHQWLSRILSNFESHLAAVKALLLQKWAEFKQTVIQPATELEQWIAQWLGRIWGYWSSHVQAVKALLLQKWQEFLQLITTWATNIEQWFLGWINRHVQFWRNLWDQVRQLVTQGWSDLWNKFSQVGQQIESWIGGWRDRVVGVIGDLRDKIGNIAGGIANNLKQGFVDGVKHIQSVFDGLFNAVKNLPGLGSVAATWKSDIDNIQGMASGGQLGAAMAGAMLPPFSRVGQGFWTNGPKAIVGEGNPNYPEAVIPTDPVHRANAAKLWHQAGQTMGFLESGGILLGGSIQALAKGGMVQLLDSGGFVGSSGAGGAAGVGGFGGQCETWVEAVEGVHFPTYDAAEMAAYVNSHTPTVGSIFVSVMPPDGHTGIVVGPNTVEDSNWNLDGIVRVHALSDVPDIAGYIDLGKGLPTGVSASSAGAGVGGFLQALLAGPEKAAESAMSSIGGWAGQMGVGILKQLESGLASLGGGSTAAAGTSAQVASWIQQAEQLAGVGADWTQGLSIIINHESGGNPSATNGYDVNAQAGNASVGLMQLTASNRAAFTPGGMNPLDPVAEIIAGIRYIESRYGSIGNVPGVRSVMSGGPYLPYDSGGYLQPGLTHVFNGTGRPEPVLTGDQWDAVQGAAASGGEVTDLLSQILTELKGGAGGITVHNHGVTANNPQAQARELGWALQTRR